MSRRARILIVLVLACVVAVWWVLRPKSPALVLYTSPPITLHQKTFRLQARIPEGWRAEAPNVGAPITLLGGQKRPAAMAAWVDIAPHEMPVGWLQQWFQPRYNGGKEDARIVLYATDPSIKPHGKSGTKTWSDGIYWHAIRTIAGPTEYEISYVRQSPFVFDSTYKEVCGSFRVLD